MTDVTWNEDKNICRPCTIHVILLALFFIISISIVSVFNYFHWHLKKSSTSFTNINRSTETVIYRMQFHWTYKWEIKNQTYYVFHDMINIKDFNNSSLLKIGKKSYKDIVIYNIGYITIKKLVIMKILIVYIHCFQLLIK